MAETIFLSYRRSDTALFALALKTELESRLTACRVFLDLQSIRPSSMWEAVVQKNLLGAKVVVCLIGDRWLGEDGNSEKPRIFDNQDWVHKEVSYALKEVPGALYPVLCGGCDLPPKEKLPQNLVLLHQIQTSQLSVDGWELGVKQIVASLVEQHGFHERKPEFNYPEHDPLKKGTSAVTPDRLESVLSILAGWELEGSDDPSHPEQMWLKKKIKFDSFEKAIAFMNRVSSECEALNHHPRWENVYDELLIRLSTFDAGHKITEHDVELASRINKIEVQGF